ncbi:MAG: D-glycero-beta-D-manno-heptose-7-phosphate kinase [Dissulfuribacterales bacterium]
MKRTPLLARNLTQLLEDAPNRHVWVVGDLLLDDYIEGDIERVSPEAPVQVVNVANEFQKLGGAANVAHGLSTLGAQVTLAGIVGCDSSAQTLLSLCTKRGIRTNSIITVKDRPTIRKLRVMSKHQQMIRIDWERIQTIDEETEKKLLENLYQTEPPDAILLSDYAKGVLTDSLILKLIKKSRELDIPVVVDPKSKQFDRYRGATILAPNLKEFRAASNQMIDPMNAESIAVSAKNICERCNISSLLVTLGELGMALWTPDSGLYQVATTAREVYDVTGAGDTVVATLALSLASGMDYHTAAIISNAAAGIVVGKAGTSTVMPHELVESLSPRVENKLLDNTSLIEHIRWWRLQKKRVVFTNGCFDLLHVGHLHILNQAAAQGDVLLVGLNTDNSIRRLNKGQERPLIPEQERASLLAAFDCVDAVILFDEDTPRNLIKQIKPDVLVKGSDYRIDQVIGKEEVETVGGKVVLVDFLPNQSSSLLIDRIRRGRRSDT